jgi:hypothetical protein
VHCDDNGAIASQIARAAEGILRKGNHGLGAQELALPPASAEHEHRNALLQSACRFCEVA